MITIILIYYNRQGLLNKTLESFLKYDPDEFNVIVVDNGSDNVVEIPSLPYHVTRVRINHKKYGHCSFSFNVGFHQAMKNNSEVIIFQGAEMYHYGNILSRTKTITDKEYLTFGCYSLSENETPESFTIKNKCMTFDGESAWYNHSIYRPVAYPFCAALTKENIKKLNGFDERFIQGCGFEDNYFLHQTKSLGLKTIIVDDTVVLHQWHKHNFPEQAAWNRNKNLYEALKKTSEFKAKHEVTPNL